MPYYVNSGNTPFGAAAGFASSFMQAQQQKQLQDQALARQSMLDQQQQQYQTAMLGDMAAKQEQNKKLLAMQQAASGVDPATGKRFSQEIPTALQEVAPHNHGRAATPEQVISHLMGLAHYYSGHGDQTDTNDAYTQINEMRAQQQAAITQALAIQNAAVRNRHYAALDAAAMSRAQTALQHVGLEGARLSLAADGLNIKAQTFALTQLMAGQGMPTAVANLIAKGKTGEMTAAQVRSQLQKMNLPANVLNALNMGIGTGKIHFAPAPTTAAPMSKQQYITDFIRVLQGANKPVGGFTSNPDPKHPGQVQVLNDLLGTPPP